MQESYFLRQYALWGEETQEALKKRSIAIIGCGGLGSTLALTLGSSGIGRVELVDFDEVSEHNIHRQLAFRLSDIGRKKANVVKELIVSRYSGVEVETHECGFDEFAKRGISVDLLIDATDNLPTRAQIEAYSKKTGSPWLYASVEEWHGQVCLFDKGEFASSFVVNDRKPAGIAAPIVSFVASFEANIALRYLAGLEVQRDVLHYLYFDAKGAFSLSKFEIPTS